MSRDQSASSMLCKTQHEMCLERTVGRPRAQMHTRLFADTEDATCLAGGSYIEKTKLQAACCEEPNIRLEVP